MPEVITDCICGQLPPLEPARREVDPTTLAACSDPFCAACLAQIAANEEALAGAHECPCCTGGTTRSGNPCLFCDGTGRVENPPGH